MRHLTLTLFLTLAMLAAPACSDVLDPPTDGEQSGVGTEPDPSRRGGASSGEPNSPRTPVLPPEDPPSDTPPQDDPPQDDPPVQGPPVQAPPDAPGCVELDAPDGSINLCYSTQDCCEGFCTYTGMDYVPGNCRAQVSVGEYCETNAWCLSGHCTDGVCEETECGGLQQSCWSTSDCCGALFCAEGGGYVPGSCAEPLPDGAACWWHDWCQSGVCTDSVCTSESCGDPGAMCYEGTECCTGLCSHDMNNPYIPGSCISAQPDGSNCLADAWCTSGTCVDGVCGQKGCWDAGTECWSDSGCCEGFCTYTGASGYTPGVCQPLQDLDAFCLADSWCESGQCVDGSCQDSACMALDANCFSGAECCSGMCTYDGQGYVQGVCTTPQPDGASCVADMWCESTSCVDGVCQDLSEVVITFSELYETVFESNGCASGYCHSDPFGALNFLDVDEAYWGLTTQTTASSDCGLEQYVVPGDPEASLLWQKVRPHADDAPWCGQKMPLGTLGLPEADAALVEAWITQGALP